MGEFELRADALYRSTLSLVTSLATPTARSLLLRIQANGHEIATATGFVVVESDGSAFLVTNWHVLAGRSSDDRSVLSPTGAIPDEVVVMHHAAGRFGSWVPKSEPLFSPSGAPRWVAHPVHQESVDLVVLPLTETEGVDLYPYETSDVTTLLPVAPSEQVSIIGFPFGQSHGGNLGIWVQGTVATEPGIDWDDLPCFLIDSRTRQGQSGSPVIIFQSGRTRQSELGVIVMGGTETIRFVGIYSGRIHVESDLGIVWKISALIDILRSAQPGHPS
jgi:Trypsin-like peptidase domain